MNSSDLFFAQPIPVSNLYHIFDKNTMRSLCGKVGLLKLNLSSELQHVTGEEIYHRGQDCKACFKRNGLALK